ncbi:hypothetical protein REB14_23570 [Chryseobacterium sp. ES2]|uniref:GNAT family N-acetyltransferase n=1 Tax=Chryseobacterium metallicongregator TaxID=3073042 RepID=A0ABU1EBQ7_9FLAO|nr:MULTISPECIES: hypothetical protein [Chryseobacterium]MDR4955170.1 hypothetical protein [Chryseobacterium sp. ES2]
MRITQNYLNQLELEQLAELAQFVVEENFNHHSDNVIPEMEIQNDVKDVYNEELSYFKNSEIFVVKDTMGSIQGSIRVIKWDYKTTLPIQKLFNINPLDIGCSQNASSVWHIGRFATNKTNQDRTLFKRLMVSAITPICNDKNSIAFAECDSKLLRVMNLMGIKADVIGDSINYLGSETIPVSMNYEGLKGFYDANRYLVS